jgi:hypothetical protein
MIMLYRSHRNLVDLVVGLARGVGEHYGEELTVSREGTGRVRIEFSEGA